jgi:hypothetical protein
LSRFSTAHRTRRLTHSTPAGTVGLDGCETRRRSSDRQLVAGTTLSARGPSVGGTRWDRRRGASPGSGRDQAGRLRRGCPTGRAGPGRCGRASLLEHSGGSAGRDDLAPPLGMVRGAGGPRSASGRCADRPEAAWPAGGSSGTGSDRGRDTDPLQRVVGAAFSGPGPAIAPPGVAMELARASRARAPIRVGCPPAGK